MKPLVLLDFDGVINAISRNGQRNVWDDWSHSTMTANGHDYPILYSPTVVSFINELSVNSSLEVRWLTTWREHTTEFTKIGLPLLSWVGVPEEDEYLHPDWWKWSVVKDFAKDRPLLWVDDDLSFKDKARRWANARADTLALAPRTHLGLTPKMLASAKEFLNTY